jgi:hypothetical protein
MREMLKNSTEADFINAFMFGRQGGSFESWRIWLIPEDLANQ